MSRSKRHVPRAGATLARSERDFKRSTHQVMRAKQRDSLWKITRGMSNGAQVFDGDAIASVLDAASVRLPQKSRDAVNPWSGPKDGKSGFTLPKNKKTRRYHKLIGK